MPAAADLLQDPPVELPNRFGRLCLRALAEGAITESKPVEPLDIAIVHIDDYRWGILPWPAAAS